MTNDAETEASGKLSAFISYSRRDASFVRQLAVGLEARGVQAVFDRSDSLRDDPDLRLTAQDDWWTALKAMIAGSEAMIFVVSSASASSAVCDDEISHARALGRRVVAIKREAIDFSRAPERLRSLNVAIDFSVDEAQAFEVALNQLDAELRVDIEFERFGVRLARLANQWDASARAEGGLLRHGAILEADRWLAQKRPGAPGPGALTLTFLEASRQKEEDDRRRLLKTIGRAFVSPSDDSYRQGRLDAALRLTAAGMLLSEDIAGALVPERDAVARFRRIAWESRLHAQLAAAPARVVGFGFSPDGTRLVTGSTDGVARVWNLERAAEELRLEHGAKVVRAAQFSRDGLRIVTGSDDRAAKVWDVETGRHLCSLSGHTEEIRSVCFSADGKRIATASEDKSVRVWDAVTGQELTVLVKHSRGAMFVQFCGDDTRVVAVDRKYGGVSLWNLDSAERLLHIDASGPRTIALSPDRAHFITGDKAGKVQVWNATTAAAATLADFPGYGIKAVSISGDGKTLLVAAKPLEGAGPTVVHVLSDGETVTFGESNSDFLDVAVDAPGDHAVTADSTGRLAIWRLSRGAEPSVIGVLPRSDVTNGEERVFAVSDHGPSRLACRSDGDVAIFDLSRDEQYLSLADERAEALSINNEASLLAALSWKKVKVFDVATGVVVSAFEDPGAYYDVALSPDGTLLSTGDALWDARRGQRIHGPSRANAHVNQIFFDTAVEHWISICRNEGDVIVRNVLTGDVTASVHAHRDRIESACISACGTFLATGSNDGTAKVFGLPYGNELTLVEGMKGGVASVAFSAASNVLATGSREGGAIVLWNAIDGTEIARLEGHRGAVVSLQFAPGDGELLSASWDGTARIWDLARSATRTVMRSPAERRWAVRRAQYLFDGAAVVSFADDGAAYVWDAHSGGLIAPLNGGGLFQKFHSFALARDGAKVVLANSILKGDGRCISIWDVTRARAYAADAAVVLAAHLTRGRGHLPAAEHAHLLLEGAPADLYAALLTRSRQGMPIPPSSGKANHMRGV